MVRVHVRARGSLVVSCAVAAGLAVVGGAPATGSAPAQPPPAADRDSGELLYVTEGNRLRRLDFDTIGTGALVEDVLVESAGRDPETGRDINGEICSRPDGAGGFVAGEDTGQPSPPAGWGVFDADGTQVGKLTATYQTAGPEPFGCAFAPDGTLFTTDVGTQGFGTANGQLVQWFPPYDAFPGPPGAYPGTDDVSTSFCKLATDLGTAGAVAVDDRNRVYVAESSGLRVVRFSPPFPTGPDAAGGCGGTDATGAPVADAVQREVLITASDGMLTFSGLAFAPNGNLYAASVLTGGIAEYDLDGNLVRFLVEPSGTTLPTPTGNPQGIAVSADGTVYYADLDLVGTLPDVRPGPNGKVRRIRFDEAGDPRPPQIVRQALAFPDGVAVLPGGLEPDEPPLPLEWPTLAGGDRRQFSNGDETALTAETAPQLVERWRFRTEAVVTSSPSVATVDLPGAGPTRAVFFTSWDGYVYALDWATGRELWRFAWEAQPGASFPAAGSPTVADLDGRRAVVVGAGETMYAVDAATGAEIWRFSAGTGCRDTASGQPPGLCGFGGERNQVETAPIVADGVVYFGMDVNDVPTGKGGFFALDGASGAMRWFFDPESGTVCRPNASDAVRRYDGYHSEAELGLPAGFLATRRGCDAPRTPNGCGNIWSSAAYDPDRQLLIFGTSNCDTDDDPATPVPPPPMPPYDEAVVALSTDGTPQWRWRPREVDNDDLAFGGAPNLFSLAIGDEVRDVVGIGNKDGTYYVIDREGRNVGNGVSWDDPDPAALPYWHTKVVQGGAIGGVIQTAAVDEASRRVYFSTGPGEDVFSPQRPTVHALDMDTGEIVWQNAEASGLAGDASYGPTSAVPGVVIAGSVITPHLRMYDAEDGKLLVDRTVGEPGTFSGVASGATVIDGTLIVGAGIGTRTSTGSSPGDFAADTPSAVVALCVPGTDGCRPPSIRPGVGVAREGDSGTTTLEVPLTLSRPIGQPVTVAWSTIGLTARSGRDFTPSSGTVTFEPLQTEAHVSIPVIGDTRVEPAELLVVAFRDPTNAEIAGQFGGRRIGFGLGIITDDPGG
jgi:outer membrane protein assembly factor BamB